MFTLAAKILSASTLALAIASASFWGLWQSAKEELAQRATAAEVAALVSDAQAKQLKIDSLTKEAANLERMRLKALRDAAALKLSNADSQRRLVEMTELLNKERANAPPTDCLRQSLPPAVIDGLLRIEAAHAAREGGGGGDDEVRADSGRVHGTIVRGDQPLSR